MVSTPRHTAVAPRRAAVSPSRSTDALTDGRGGGCASCSVAPARGRRNGTGGCRAHHWLAASLAPVRPRRSAKSDAGNSRGRSGGRSCRVTDSEARSLRTPRETVAEIVRDRYETGREERSPVPSRFRSGEGASGAPGELPQACGDLDGESEEVDEPLGISLVVDSVGAERRQFHAVQAVG